MDLKSQDVVPSETRPTFTFINSLVTILATPVTTEQSFSVFRQVAPPGFATPYHSHEAYGEAFYVLDGEVTFFYSDKKTVLTSGGFLFVPGSPHGFRVTSATPATMMIVSPPESSFAAFVQEMGTSVAAAELPVPSPPDFAKLAALSAKYGSTILGPLPD